MRYRVIHSLVVAALLSVAPAAAADIYKYVDKWGSIHLSDKPKHRGYKLIVRSYRNGPYKEAPRFRPGNLARYKSMIRKVAQRYRLDDALLTAIIHAESAFDAHAVSKTGAVGLMQLMPATSRYYGVRNPWNPEANIDAGARHLKDLLKRFKNNLTLALAAYNAGESAVIKYGNRVPPFPETRRYINKVYNYYRQYRRRL